MIDNAIRPKLRMDTEVLATSSGCVFRCRDKAFTIKGAGVGRLVSALLPLLSGTRTVASICEGSSAKSRSALEAILETLISKQVVGTQVTEDIALPPAVVKRFSEQLRFMEHWSDRPLFRFSRFRNARVLVTGDGDAVESLCESLLANGLKTVLVDQAAGGLDLPALRRQADRLCAEGVEAAVLSGSLESLIEGGEDEVRAVCVVGNDADRPHLLKINRFCIEHDILCIPGYMHAGRLVVGPRVRRRPGCVQCTWLRQEAHLGCAAGEGSARDRAEYREWRRVLGSFVGFEVFLALAGQDSGDADPGIKSLDPDTAERRTVRLAPHPACPHCAHLAEQVSPSAAAGGLTRDERMEKLESLCDPEYGVFAGYEDDAILQTPLFQSAIRLQGSGRSPDGVVPGYSLTSNADARISAALQAAKWYVTQAAREASVPGEAVQGAGMGAGFSLDEAAQEAVAAAAGNEIRRRAARGELVLQPLDAEQLAQKNPDVRYLMTVLAELGAPIRLSGYEVNGLGAIAIAADSAGSATAVASTASGKDLMQAAVGAMTEFVGRLLRDPQSVAARAPLPEDAGLEFPGGHGSSRRIPLGHSIPLPWESPANGNQEILVCDVTTPDIAASGVTVCKAFITRQGDGWV